jgi:hypothetical protein
MPLFCLLALAVLLSVAGLLTELNRVDTARTLAAVQARQRREDSS